jgi:RNA polymerase sigma factor (sigma-70 family)
MSGLKVIPGRSAADRFEALLRPHYDVLFRTAYRFTRSVHDAEDLVQDVCVRAFPRLDELDGLEDPRGWLMLVMRRLFIDRTRRYERKHVESLETADATALVCAEPGPFEAAVQSGDRERLDFAWRHLDADQRSLLALHDIEGYSLAELMDITGLKEGTLKSRLHRARVKLARLLERHERVAKLRAVGGEP